MSRLRTFLIVCVLMALVSPGAGAVTPERRINGIPVAPAGVGVIASPNLELLTTVPDIGMTGGRFAAGYFFATVSGSGFFEPNPNSGFRIYDVANPEMPILKGALPLPHAENEDVDISVSRRLALISFDTITAGRVASVALSKDGPQHVDGDKLYIVSWANPAMPQLIGTLVLPEEFTTPDKKTSSGPGHITNCIQDCKRYAYVTGAGNGAVFVVDLLDPSAPRIAKILPPSLIKAAGPGGSWKTGSIHDVNTDQYGYVWMTGRGGTAMFDARNPLNPKPLKWISRRDNARWDQFIHHNSMRLDKQTVLITEEDWLQPNCRRDQATGAGEFTIEPGEQGGFQTWRIDPKRGSEGAITHLDQWITELEQYASGSAAVNVVCSSHWFTFNRNRVVAVGWYNQGVRLLDVSNPRDIRQVGYWLGPNTTASAAYFAPGRDDIVYIADYGRGFDVIKLANGGRRSATVVAPIRAEWLASSQSNAAQVAFDPHPVFGWACPVPKRPSVSAIDPAR